MSDAKQFDKFVKQLEASGPRLRYEELEAIRNDSRRLWVEASKICCDHFRRICSHPQAVVGLQDMDALQNAIVAAGSALPRWKPALGSLSTFLWPIVLRECSAYAHSERTGGVGSSAVYAEHTQLPGEDAAYDEDSDEAEGFNTLLPAALIDDPDMAGELYKERIHTYAKAQLSTDDYNLLAMRLGLCGKQLSVNDIAKTLSVDRKTIARRIDRIKKCLIGALE
jgi:DNA-directed RNA polymerase specialized sigma24 family protein